MSRFVYIAPLLALSILVSIALTACGIKPSNLQPPDADAVHTFPRTYPAPPAGQSTPADTDLPADAQK